MNAKKTKKEESAILAEIAIKGMQEKKAKEIICMDLRKVHNSVSDFFVICHGDSNTQVDAIAGSVEEEIRKAIGEKPWHREGFQNAEWILLDYVSVVVHVFQKEKRDFYKLEALWADAKTELIAS
jgi:ribosome-associated protein